MMEEFDRTHCKRSLFAQPRLEAGLHGLGDHECCSLQCISRIWKPKRERVKSSKSQDRSKYLAYVCRQGTMFGFDHRAHLSPLRTDRMACRPTPLCCKPIAFLSNSLLLLLLLLLSDLFFTADSRLDAEPVINWPLLLLTSPHLLLRCTVAQWTIVMEFIFDQFY